MTQLERLKKRITDDVDDDVLEDILESAKAVILSFLLYEFMRSL